MGPKGVKGYLGSKVSQVRDLSSRRERERERETNRERERERERRERERLKKEREILELHRFCVGLWGSTPITVNQMDIRRKI